MQQIADAGHCPLSPDAHDPYQVENARSLVSRVGEVGVTYAGWRESGTKFHHEDTMTQHINIQIPGQSLSVPLPALLSLMAGEPANAPALALPAEFGAPLQGGFYAGPHWEDGKLVHLIGANESLGDAEWDAAKTKAGKYFDDGHDDWFLPTKDQLTVGLLYAKDKFEPVWHWTQSLYGSYYAWAVDFEDGGVHFCGRDDEFRVRPFRRLSI